MPTRNSFEVFFNGKAKSGYHHFLTIGNNESPIVRKDKNIYINPKYAKNIDMSKLDKKTKYIIMVDITSFTRPDTDEKMYYVCKLVSIKPKHNPIEKFFKKKSTKSELRIVKCRKVKTPTTRDEDAGYDFYLPDSYGDTTLEPGFDIKIPSGIRVDVPEGYMFVAFNKSGVSTKQKLQVGACVVDSGYTGEVHLHLFNYSNETAQIKRQQKLTQFILVPVIKPKIIIADDIEKDSERGDGAFGSTN